MPPLNQARYNQLLKELDAIPSQVDACMAKLAYATEESAKPVNEKIEKLEIRKKELLNTLTGMRLAEEERQKSEKKAADAKELQRKEAGKVDVERKAKAGKILCATCQGPVIALRPEVRRPGWWTTPTNTAQDWLKWWIPLECQNPECRVLDRYFPDRPEELEGTCE